MSLPPLLFRLPHLAAAGLLLCALPVSVLSWSDSGPAFASDTSASLQTAEDPTEDYWALSLRLSRLGLSQTQIRILWNRMGSDLARQLNEGGLLFADLAYLALPNGRADLLERYKAFSLRSPALTAEEVVLQVNMGLDRPFYEDTQVVSSPAVTDVLVNKYHVLPADYVPELTPLTGLGSGSLTPSAAEAFRQMAEAAQADGISLRSVSAYRSYQTQRALYHSYASQWGQANADTYSARAGSSEHQTGLAVDINVATRSAHFENTATYAWLLEHCADYGFILRYPEEKQHITGYRFEPWHYRYVGTEIARVCMEQNLAYEEYMALLPAEESVLPPRLMFQGAVLELGEVPLLLNGTFYFPAAPLARALDWSVTWDGQELVLSCPGRQVVLAPWSRCQADGVILEQTSPALPLDGSLYLPLEDLCAVLGVALEQTDSGDHLLSLT